MKKKINFWLIVAGIGFGLLAVYLLIKPQFSNSSFDLAASIGGWLSLVLSGLSILKLVKDLAKADPPAPVTPVVTSGPTVASNNIHAPINARNVVMQVNQGSNASPVTDTAGSKRSVQKKSSTSKAKKTTTTKKSSARSKKTGTARKAVA